MHVAGGSKAVAPIRERGEQHSEPATRQNGPMNRPQDSSAGARGNGSAFLKGALLIGLAVVIGVVLLQVTDDRPRRRRRTPS
jgi:hypothetical protein